MRILFDTNIFIYREDDGVVSENLQQLIRTFNELDYSILLHPLSIQELENDKDILRREKVLSKVRTYKMLKEPPTSENDVEFNEIVGESNNVHDIIDNNLLYAVYRNAASFLITEDRYIIKKSVSLDLDNVVLSIDDAINTFEKFLKKQKIISPPALSEEYPYNLDLKDEFFDLLRIDYDFDNWFREKVCTRDEKCLVNRIEGGKIGALVIYKNENEQIGVKPVLPKKERLKICTFKVTNRGNYIGELLIRLSIEKAINEGVSELYMTAFSDKQPQLVNLITEYGFEHSSVNERDEGIYVKKITLDPDDFSGVRRSDISKRFYPHFYDGPVNRKFIVPIVPEYYDRLFTDSHGRQTTLLEHIGDFIIEGNTIKKAYLTNSRITKIRAGDIIIFYRSHDWRCVTSVGVVEKVHLRITDPDVIVQRVGKRTVYTRDEIVEMSKKPTTVILFRHHFYFKNMVKYQMLLDRGIINGAPQTIIEIQHDKYQILKETGGIDGRFTVN